MPASAIEYIVKEFPILHDEVYDETWHDLFHVQLIYFANLSISAIKSRDAVIFERACFVALHLFQHGDDEVVNGINVSFLENIEFQVEGADIPWLRTHMPEHLLSAYDAMKHYNDMIMGQAANQAVKPNP